MVVKLLKFTALIERIHCSGGLGYLGRMLDQFEVGSGSISLSFDPINGRVSICNY